MRRVRHAGNELRSPGKWKRTGRVRRATSRASSLSIVIYNPGTSIPRHTPRLWRFDKPSSTIYQARLKNDYFPSWRRKRGERRGNGSPTNALSLSLTFFLCPRVGAIINYTNRVAVLSSHGNLVRKLKDIPPWETREPEVLRARCLPATLELRYRDGNWHHFHG